MTLTPHSIIHGDAYFAYFNKIWGIPGRTINLVWALAFLSGLLGYWVALFALT